MTDDAIPAGMDTASNVAISGLQPVPGHAEGCGVHDDYDCDCAYTPAPSIVTGSDERAREVDIHETMRLVEYDMTNRRRDGDGFVGERKEVAAIITALRAALAASRPTDAGAGLLREALERIQDEPLHTLPIVTTQRMRNIASYALRGERLA